MPFHHDSGYLGEEVAITMLERIQGPLAVIGGLALLVMAGLALVAGEFSVPARLALAVAILCIGGAIAIDPGRAFQMLKRRESIYGTNTVIIIVALVGILALLNVLGARFSQRWDLTAQRDFSLSEATVKVLGELPQPVTAKAFFSGSLSDRQKAEDLMKEYQARSGGKLTWR